LRLPWQRPAVGTARVLPAVFGSRRTFLCSMVLSGLLLVTCTLTTARMSIGVRAAMWGLFAWSLVVTAYAVYTYLAVRRSAPSAPGESSLTDPLTGLPNRKGLMTALEGYDLDVEEFGRRVRLIDVDMMNLSKVNYEFGQMIGDVVLQDLADLLRQRAPANGLVGRLGGDEFLVIMPSASAEDAEAVAESFRTHIAQYSLNLGERGEVRGLKARVSVATYLPDQASLHETVVRAKEATAHGRLPESTGEEEAFYHVPRVTLGAFAVRRWQGLSQKDRSDFKLWQREPAVNEFLEGMVIDIVRMLDEKAETHWVDFVTTAPSAGGRNSPGKCLAEAVARHMGVPYRDVMRADSSGPETRSIEPAVDAVIDKGDGALLVIDVISSGILERRCVKKLSAAGAHIQVAAWAAY
jgi:diguanylate cyclase (GGDEF)-like protein